MRIARFLAVIIATMLLVACGEDAPSTRLNGVWKTDIEKTVSTNTEYFQRNKVNKQDFSREFSKGELSFDVKNQQCIMNGAAKEKYNILNESKDEVQIKFERVDLDIKVKFNGKNEMTFVYLNDRHMPILVFARSK